MIGREWIFALISIVFSFAFTLIIAEIFLRFLPVASRVYFAPITYEDPVKHFVPNQTTLWSRDWDFSIVNKNMINNKGFMNNQNYEDGETILAVIGDSYIEASMVPYTETVHGRLAQYAEDKHEPYKVYSFGLSGAPMSQYLIWAKHAAENYKVKRFIFSIVGNDFDESLPAYQQDRGVYYYIENEDGSLELQMPREYIPCNVNHNGFSTWFKCSSLKRFISELALVRYLRLNLKVDMTLASFKRSLTKNEHYDQNKTHDYVGNTSSDINPVRIKDSKRVVDAFLRDLPKYTQKPVSDIAFTVDAARPLIYETQELPTTGNTYYEIMREYFIKQARTKGYVVLDMQKPFFDHHTQTGEKMEFPTDGHWNSLGHGLVYEEVINSDWFQSM